MLLGYLQAVVWAIASGRTGATRRRDDATAVLGAATTFSSTVKVKLMTLSHVDFVRPTTYVSY